MVLKEKITNVLAFRAEIKRQNVLKENKKKSESFRNQPRSRTIKPKRWNTPATKGAVGNRALRESVIHHAFSTVAKERVVKFLGFFSFYLFLLKLFSWLVCWKTEILSQQSAVSSQRLWELNNNPKSGVSVDHIFSDLFLLVLPQHRKRERIIIVILFSNKKKANVFLPSTDYIV